MLEQASIRKAASYGKRPVCPPVSTSIIDLVKQEKPVVVYVAGNRSFFALKGAEQLVEMLKQVAPSALQKLEPSLASQAPL